MGVLQNRNQSTSIGLLFDVSIDNPNALEVDLDSYTYELEIENKPLISGTENKLLQIPSDSTLVLPVPMNVSYSELYNFISSYKDNETVSYTFRSSFLVDVPLVGPVRVPVEKKGEFPLIKRPKIAFDGIQLDKLSFREAKLNVAVEVANPNAFDLDLSRFQYKLSLQNMTTLNATNNGPYRIPSGGSTILNIPVRLSFTELGMALYRTLTKTSEIEASITSKLDLNAGLEAFSLTTIEFDKTAILDLIRNN